jgi:hypothetical protein
MRVVAPAGAFAVRAYESADAAEWDELVRRSRSGHFFFLRGYMEYHADRFDDASLVVHDGERMVAGLPATRHGDTIVSHGGLTFGGLVSPPELTTRRTVVAFDAVLRTLARAGARRLVYKPVPHIYHALPNEEDLYALFLHGARLVRRDVSAALRPGLAGRYSKGRASGIRQAHRWNPTIEECGDFDAFMSLESEALETRHGVSPAHTADEMRLLATRFRENIRLFCVRSARRMIAGTIIYETPMVAHAQYIGATGEGRELHALDALLHELVTDVFADKRWFDFGISTTGQGRVLNEGLSRNKESFGARAVAYDWYELDLVEQPRGQPS